MIFVILVTLREKTVNVSDELGLKEGGVQDSIQSMGTGQAEKQTPQKTKVKVDERQKTLCSNVKGLNFFLFTEKR